MDLKPDLDILREVYHLDEKQLFAVERKMMLAIGDAIKEFKENPAKFVDDFSTAGLILKSKILAEQYSKD